MALALEHANVTREEMADEIGRGVTTVRNYLSGRTDPPVAVQRVWAFRTGVPYEWLRYGIIDLDGPVTPGGQVIDGSGWFNRSNMSQTDLLAS